MTTRTAVASLVLACAAVTLGQAGPNPDAPNVIGNGVDPSRAVDAQAVYVRDSGVAGERLQLADRLEKQKEWNKAADVCQDLAQKFADRVVPVRLDAAGRPVQYVSATQAVQDRLAGWPAEGIAAYRRRFEDTARDLLAADASERTAARVMTLYFLTDAGRDAALRVASAAFERGDFVTAAGVGRRLLDAHPGLADGRPKVLLQTGLAEHAAGRDGDAKKRLDELRGKFSDAKVKVGGVDASAADTLADALAVPAASPGRYHSDDWPNPYGTTDADAVPDQVCVGGARLFSVALPGPSRRNLSAAGVIPYRKAQETDRRTGASTGILPAVDGNTLFFQDNARVWAVGLSNGLPLPGWAATYSGDRGGCYAVDADPTPRNRQTAVSVTADGVVALLGQYDAAAANAAGQSGQKPQLVCLDKLTGRRNWAATANTLKLPDALAGLREGVFYGTPVVDDDTVYVPLYANRGGQFEECHLVALNLADGTFKWASYVASTSLGSRAMDFDGIADSNTLTVATLSLAGGRLYVSTNLGAVACLDAADGRTRWLNVYEKTKLQFAGFIAPQRRSSKPFAFGPPVVADGRVFVLPTDSPSVLIYDANDGSPVREIKRKIDRKFADVVSVVGVIDNALILANQSTIFRLPWRSFDPLKSVLDNGGRFKNIPPAKGDTGSPPDSIRGRVFVSGKSVLVPTAERLYRLSPTDLQIESQYPAQGVWDEDESAGNIVATPDNLIVAGPTRVTAYADLAVATAKLDARIAANANDADAYLRYAELLLAAGQPKPALERLDQAAERLGGKDRLARGPQRDRLFEIAVGFAAKLQRSEPPSAFVTDLYDRAAPAAATAEQQARYRLGRATAMRALGRAEEELALHQQVLADPAWRAVAVAGRTGPSTAGVEAEAGVNELLRLRGVALYAAYDKAAFDQLDALKKSGAPDSAALIALADAYPAAASVPDALALAADRMESAGEPRRASQTLRRLLARDVSNDRRQAVLQALARNALRVPNQAAVAQVRLRQAIAIAPEAKPDRPLALPDGTPLPADTLAAAVAAIDAYRVKAERDALPTLDVPLTSGDVSEFKAAFKPTETVAAAAAIVAQQADVARPNRVVISDPAGRIAVVDAASGAVARTDARAAQTPIGCGFVGDTLVVVGPEGVSALDAAGHVQWTVRVAALPALEVAPLPSAEDRVIDADPIEQPFRGMNGRRIQLNRPIIVRRGALIPPRPPVFDDAPPPGGEQFTRFRLLSDRVVATTSTGRVMALDLTGRTAWQARPSDVAAGRLVSNDDFVVTSHADPAGTSTQVCVFDAQTGQIVQRKAYEPGQQVPGGLVNLALSPDGVLVTLQAGRLTGQDLYDLGSGERKYDRPGIGEPPFTQSTLDNQLVVSRDRVLAVVRGVNGQQSVRAYDLRTMRPVTVNEPTGRQGEASFTPGGGDAETLQPVTVRANGTTFYVVGQQSLGGFDLARPDAAWYAGGGAGDKGPTRDVLLAKDFVVLIRQATMAGTGSPKLPAVNVSMFSRAAVTESNKESGVLEQTPTVQDSAAILAGEWQLADGAMFYVSGDQKLRVLRANR